MHLLALSILVGFFGADRYTELKWIHVRESNWVEPR
jgi:hypothetical protein